ncbi:MAG: hypothetical protein A2X56_09520 [Nitrospirae bacterium GWC2_57_13]|nr:MAG: hypothetical protein A2X56_09520 [Nitrospirae bacterium GWC2_57_13]
MPKIPGRVLPDQPVNRPLDRFWPYADLPEQPSQEELETLHPELREALFGAESLPFSVTLSFPVFDGDGYGKAMELARGADDLRAIGTGLTARHFATYFPGKSPSRLRDLWDVVHAVPGCEVLVDNKPVPYARELWLPMIWLLIR